MALVDESALVDGQVMSDDDRPGLKQLERFQGELTMTTTVAPTSPGYAPVNGLQLYYESYGEGGTPLILLHGGFGMTGMFGDLPARLADQRRVIAVDLQGHGRTADIDRAADHAGDGRRHRCSGRVSRARSGRRDGLLAGRRGGPAHRDPAPRPGPEAGAGVDAVPQGRLVSGRRRPDGLREPQRVRDDAADPDVRGVCGDRAEPGCLPRPDGQGRCAAGS